MKSAGNMAPLNAEGYSSLLVFWIDRYGRFTPQAIATEAKVAFPEVTEQEIEYALGRFLEMLNVAYRVITKIYTEPGFSSDNAVLELRQAYPELDQYAFEKLYEFGTWCVSKG